MDSNKYFAYYQVEKGDSVYDIAKRNNISSSLLAQLNGLNEDDYIYPGQIIIVPKPGIILYITSVGDTLGEVCLGINGDMDSLLNENKNIYLQPEQLIVYKKK